MGVITTGVIPAGKVFGPIPPNLTLTDPALLIGHMTCDNRPDVHTVKLDLNDYSDERRAGEWVPYVQAARDEREQNLEAYLQDGRLRYRAIRTIGAGENVLVWYSKELAVLIGVPELQSFHIKEGGIFQCPYCMTNFRFPNSLRAHMRFKCEHRRNVHPMDPIQAGVAMATREMKEKLLASGFIDYRAHLYAGFPPRLPPTSRISTESLLSAGTIPSPGSSSGSTNLSSPGKYSPGSDRKRSRSRSPPGSSGSPTRRSPFENTGRKRSLDTDDEYSSVKKLATEESRKPETFSPREGSQSPESFPKRHSSPSGVKSKKSRIDLNQNVNNPSDDEENVSAFRKVEKHHPSLLPSVPSPADQQPLSYNITASNPVTALYNNPAINGSEKSPIFGKNIRPEGGIIPRYPLLPPGSIPPAFLASSLNENIPANLAELYRNPGKIANMGRSVVKLDDINNIENNNIVGKLPAYFGAESRGIGVSMQFGYYKSPNPMVDKLLHTNTSAAPTVAPQNLAALATNWCAKCNATFRMTSDLVYHMRSHHKSHIDPMKKKREDKLKCNICGETFRERHHLTRHMTSHA